MAYCGKCGTQLSDGNKFCPKCGNPVVNEQVYNDSPENNLRYSLELISSGPEILQLTKILMDLLGIEMREAKDIIKSTPTTLVTGISLSRAEEITQILQKIGADAVMKPVQSKQPIQISPLSQIKEQTERARNNSYVEEYPQESYYDRNSGVIIKAVCFIVAGLLLLWYMGFFEGTILTIPGGRAAFAVENQNCSNTNLKSINKIILYQGNSRQDCKVEGETKSGEVFTLNGRWELEDVEGFSFRKYYFLQFRDFNLLINGDKEVCFHKYGDSDINYALEHSSIGKLRPIAQDEENHISNEFNKKLELYEKEAETTAKIKKIADMAYQKGWNRRMKSKDFADPRSSAHMEYTMRYGVEPTEPGEEKRWNIFVENYVKGYVAAWEEIRKKMHSEDL